MNFDFLTYAALIFIIFYLALPVDIPVIYQDNDLLVINKPNNLIVHHSYYARNIEETSLVQLLKETYGIDLYPVHRLDRKTSGIIIFAKSPEITASLQKQFENQEITKTYYALVRGFTQPDGIIDSPVKNDDSKIYQEALTHYKTIASVEANYAVQPYNSVRYSLLQLSPKTGRMHQLRKHANKIAHPIIGDPKYGNRHHNHFFINEFEIDKLFLHAAQIEFNHPITGQRIEVSAAFPLFWLETFGKLGFVVDFKILLNKDIR